MRAALPRPESPPGSPPPGRDRPPRRPRPSGPPGNSGPCEKSRTSAVNGTARGPLGQRLKDEASSEREGLERVREAARRVVKEILPSQGEVLQELDVHPEAPVGAQLEI